MCSRCLKHQLRSWAPDSCNSLFRSILKTHVFLLTFLPCFISCLTPHFNILTTTIAKAAWEWACSLLFHLCNPHLSPWLPSPPQFILHLLPLSVVLSVSFPGRDVEQSFSKEALSHQVLKPTGDLTSGPKSHCLRSHTLGKWVAWLSEALIIQELLLMRMLSTTENRVTYLNTSLDAWSQAYLFDNSDPNSLYRLLNLRDCSINNHSTPKAGVANLQHLPQLHEQLLCVALNRSGSEQGAHLQIGQEAERAADQARSTGQGADSRATDQARERVQSNTLKRA